MDLFTLIAVLILLGLVLWLLGQIPIDPTINRIIRVVVLVVVILWLIRVLVGPIHLPLLR